MANSARTYVEQHAFALRKWAKDGIEIHGSPQPIYEFLTEHGEEFNGRELPERFKLGIPRYCFGNAWRLARRYRTLTYYEGFASSGVFPVHHAWCVDRAGEIVDTTWTPDDYRNGPSEWEYFGVPFNARDDRMNFWMKSKPIWGVLFSLRYDLPDFGTGVGLTLEEILGRVAA